MKKMFNTLFIDLGRSFGTLNFYVTLLSVCVIYYMGAWSELGTAKDILLLFKYSGEGSTFNMLMVMVCVLPYSTSFCSDWNSQNIRSCVIRTGCVKYCLSKVISCALSSGCAMMLGMVLFLISLLPRLPLVSVRATNYEYFATRTLAGEFLLQNQYIKYFLVYILLGFLTGALWSIVGLFISAYVPNKFVIICGPFIIYYFLNLISYSFPIYLRLEKVYTGKCILGGTWTSLFYAVFLFIVLSVTVSILFTRSVKRRLANA